jgi:hypothetical protein
MKDSGYPRIGGWGEGFQEANNLIDLIMSFVTVLFLVVKLDKLGCGVLVFTVLWRLQDEEAA